MKKILLLLSLCLLSCGQSDDTQYAKEIAQSSASDIYKKNCYMCHDYGASGAPKIGDAEEWDKRIQARGLSSLLENTINGYNAMPKKGMCIQCTHEQLEGVVKYMIKGTQ